MGKLPNYVQYFGSNIVEGVAESWVEAEMSWVEVDGAGWRWVHGLVIPIYFYEKDYTYPIFKTILRLYLFSQKRLYLCHAMICRLSSDSGWLGCDLTE